MDNISLKKLQDQLCICADLGCMDTYYFKFHYISRRDVETRKSFLDWHNELHREF